MNYHIRNAVREDMEQVLNLITELAIFEKEPNAVEVTDLFFHLYASRMHH